LRRVIVPRLGLREPSNGPIRLNSTCEGTSGSPHRCLGQESAAYNELPLINDGAELEFKED
jgi:hypothetical protein